MKKNVMKKLFALVLVLTVLMGITMMCSANGEGSLVEIVNESGDDLQYGDLVLLRANVEDAEAVSFQWQVSENGIDFENILGATAEAYRFCADENTANNEYRFWVVVK